MPSQLPVVCIDFHNIVAAAIHTDDREAHEHFCAEYDHHLVEAIPDDVPTVEFHFNKHPLATQSQAFTHHSHKGIARWSYHLEMTRDSIKIVATGNRLSIPMIHHMLLHHSLRYLAAQKGVILLHAGAIVNAGRSLILTGKGGAGKTTTTSLVLAEGAGEWDYHADDYVFITPEPASLAYLTRSHLYRTLLDWVPEIDQRLTRREKIRLDLFGNLRSLSKENVKWPVRMSLKRMWPDLEPVMKASPAGLLVLKRGDLEEPTLERLSSPGDMLEDLISMNFTEARHFLQLIQKNQSVPEFQTWLAEWRSREKALLERLLTLIPAYTLQLPTKLSPSKFQRTTLVNQLTQITQQKAVPDV